MTNLRYLQFILLGVSLFVKLTGGANGGEGANLSQRLNVMRYMYRNSLRPKPHFAIRITLTILHLDHHFNIIIKTMPSISRFLLLILVINLTSCQPYYDPYIDGILNYFKTKNQRQMLGVLFSTLKIIGKKIVLNTQLKISGIEVYSQYDTKIFQQGSKKGVQGGTIDILVVSYNSLKLPYQQVIINLAYGHHVQDALQQAKLYQGFENARTNLKPSTYVGISVFKGLKVSIQNRFFGGRLWDCIKLYLPAIKLSQKGIMVNDIHYQNDL